MDWININVATLVSPEFLGSDPIDRASWICLLRHCVMQENGGIIEDCADWKDRRWQQVCGITLKEALRKCDLWAWEGKNLHISFYPSAKEQEVKSKRLVARTNGVKGGRPPQDKLTDVETDVGSHVGSEEKPTSETVKEGKGTIKEGKVSAVPASEVVEAWNGLPQKYQRVEVLSSGRRTTLNARLKEKWWRDNWQKALAKIPECPFLSGENARGWTADFDFFIRPDTAAKIIEGKYGEQPSLTPADDEYHERDPAKVAAMRKRMLEEQANGR